jgi:hypothetical protein
VPQWIITKSGVLFGTINVNDGLTTLSGPNMSWIRKATPQLGYVYPTLLPAGFVNSPFAVTGSHYDGTGLSGTYALSMSGGGLAHDINTTVTFTSSATGSTMTTNGPVTAGKIDNTGKLQIAFLDGLPSKHKTIAVGTVLQNATNGAGFFIINATGHSPTNSGNLILTPQ